MEDNYNLDDFFKNKFDDLSDESTDWDRPRGNAWVTARQQMATQTMQRYKRKTLWGALLLGFLLLSSMGYGVYLCNQVNHLQEQLLQKEQALLQQANELQTLRAASANTPIAQSNSEEKTAKPIKIATPPTNLTRTIQPANDHVLLLAKLRDSVQLLQTRLAQNEVPKLERRKPFGISMLPNPQKPLSIEKTSIALPVKPTIKAFASTPATRKKDFQRFEVGLKMSFLPYRVPITSLVTSSSSIQGESEDLEAVTNLAALQLSYGIRPNLYLQTGIRYANLEWIAGSISGIIYDKSSEFTLPNGTVANNITLESRSSFGNTDQEITVEIPDGTELETGDLLIMTLNNYLNIDFLHIPFGVSYFHGMKRWQVEYLGGLIYNYVGINNAQIQANFQANNIDIPVGRIRTLDESQSVSQFFTAYAGIGVNYRLSHRLHARANLTIEDNTHDFNSKQLFRFNDVRPGLNFSLNYRF